MDGRNVQEIFYVVVKNVRPAGNKALPEADGWVERGHRAELARLQAEADRLDYNFLQKQIMMETSFSGSEGELDVSPCIGRNVIQRTQSEELRLSNSDSDVSELLTPMFALTVRGL